MITFAWRTPEGITLEDWLECRAKAASQANGCSTRDKQGHINSIIKTSVMLPRSQNVRIEFDNRPHHMLMGVPLGISRDFLTQASLQLCLDIVCIYALMY